MVNHIIAVLLFLFFALGIVIGFLMVLHKEFTKGFLETPWIKYATSLIKMVSAVLAGYIKYAESNFDQKADDVLVFSFFLSLIDIFMWEVIGIGAERKRQRVSDEIEETQNEMFRLIALVASIRDLVLKRKHCISEVLEARTPNITPYALIKLTRKGFMVDSHISLTLESLALYLSGTLPAKDRLSQNFRVGFYVEENGHLRERASFSSKNQAKSVLKSYFVAPDRFHLSNQINPAQVVLCVQKGCTQIVSDCEKELGDFIHNEQANYLKSLVAFPILNYGCGSEVGKKAAIVVDTDVPGYFREEDRDEIDRVLREFAVRLDLESSIFQLLELDGKKTNGLSKPEKRKA